ncbi:carbohydrate-binding module family 42 protein [Zasmidium cellare ATCC 36951]|uniref:Alpha-L-arabinofuranosidase n=1 Tax=Zasmidium cellare ATCC 36951 TaxID=1080233 RepID=A0A6A6CDF1_ZASCE|nr:carbohydrate-binding module family 42 protein [Zasmidium cellare ATCC 36951]KAF2163466.1 carbohydrate-binding module family 42 protein [Zasmidium cellare ATCC 36951]
MLFHSNLLAQAGIVVFLPLAIAGPSLFDSYNDPLYQIKRGSDNQTLPIYPLQAGGIANASAQDSFCANTTCVISIIYDQTSNGNNLTQAPPGSAAKGPNPGGLDDLVLAAGAPITVNGQKAYGVFIQPNSGYRIDNTTIVAKDDQPEGMYAVFDGTHYNSHCCFDYGNAESDNIDMGNVSNGAMEAINFSGGDGSGPLVNTIPVTNNSSSTLKGQASFTVQTGLGNSMCVAFESKDVAGSYIRHNTTTYRLRIDPDDGTKQMHEDATFCPEAGLNMTGNLIRSWNFPTRSIRHFDAECWIAANGGPYPEDTTNSYNNDVSWLIGESFV